MLNLTYNTLTTVISNAIVGDKTGVADWTSIGVTSLIDTVNTEAKVLKAIVNGTISFVASLDDDYDVSTALFVGAVNAVSSSTSMNDFIEKVSKETLEWQGSVALGLTLGFSQSFGVSAISKGSKIRATKLDLHHRLFPQLKNPKSVSGGGVYR